MKSNFCPFYLLVLVLVLLVLLVLLLFLLIVVVITIVIIVVSRRRRRRHGNPSSTRSYLTATGNVVDVFHTFFGVAGLQLLGDTSLNEIGTSLPRAPSP